MWSKELQKEISQKRTEENVKFVFKLAFKHLRTDYFNRNQLKPNIVESETEFYHFYFGETANAMQLPISAFYDPLNFKTDQKTLTFDFLNRIFKSLTFKAAFLEYLASGKLKEDYQSSIPVKISKLLSRFDKILVSREPEKLAKAISSVQSYFRLNRQCKIPWTEAEVDGAIANIIKYLNVNKY